MKKLLNFCFFTLISSLFSTFFSLAAHGQANITSKPIVTNITAEAYSSNKIVISWSLPVNTKDYYISQLLLYRNTKPITSYTQISELSPLAKLPYNSVSYKDTLKDYKSYYYALVSIVKKGSWSNYTTEDDAKQELYYDEELDGKLDRKQDSKLYLLILPGVNSTVKGCRVTGVKSLHKQPKQEQEKVKKYDEGQLREKPLPYIAIENERKKKAKIQSSTEEKALTLLRPERKKATEAQVLPPYFFQEDIKSPAGGDEYLLFEVLKGSFVKQDYKKAIDELNTFLAQNRNKAVTDRANFYLGEAYYFCAMYPQALNQFLMLEETFTVLSRKWSKSTLDLYTIPSSQESSY